jgi:uncharacterized membrane protein
MSTVEQSIEVDVPVRVAYNRWTQFETFPQFMDGVEEVRQLDETHLHWRARVGGREAEWDAVITEQIPDEVIAWRATDGKANGGVVRFESIGGTSTRVIVRIEYESEGVMEKVGAAVGADSRQVGNGLESFKEIVEAGGGTPGWRGTVKDGDTL